MTFKEFLDYLEKNLVNYDLFQIKAEEHQKEKNKKRAPKKRWEEKKVLKTADGMWVASMRIAYDKIKSKVGNPRFDAYQAWIDCMSKHEMLENLNDSISELEFE